MIRNLLATTAVAALLTTGALAQTTPPAADTPAPAASAPAAVADGHLASNLIGERVYNGTGDDAENVGEVNDLVIGANGNVEQIVVGVGGFLGIGEKDVALAYNEIDWADRDGDRWIVVSATTDQLRELPAFDRTAYEPAGAANTAGTASNTTAPASDTTAAAPAAPASDTTAAAPAAPANDTAAAPAANQGGSNMAAAPADNASDETAAIDKSKLKPLDAATISSEEIEGTTVYGMNDDRIGEVGDVIMQGDKVDAIVLDVGGFLGVGEKQVAVGMDNLQFLTDEDGDNYLYTKLTKEQLEGQPAYEEANYAQQRDQMRMVVPQ